METTATIFTQDELHDLMEALDAWEVKDTASNLMTGLIGALVFKEGEGKDKWEAEQREVEAEQERDRQVRKRKSVMLKAKLIAMSAEG